MNKQENKTNVLQLIPKTEEYIQYILEIILKLPRTEKFNIGNEYKISMYQMLNKILLLSKIKDKKLLDLLEKIIYSSEGEYGLAIGNYTSQMFANIYLNEVDQYAKHILHCKYYFRYLDDSVILLRTKEETKKVLEKIQEFLKQNLELELNSKTQIFPAKQGVNFCGYKIKEYRLKIRDRGKRKLKKKVKKLKYQIQIGEISSKEAKKYLAGHIGYLQYANTQNLMQKVFYMRSKKK